MIEIERNRKMKIVRTVMNKLSFCPIFVNPLNEISSLNP